jgi:hypothetical protein
MGMVDRVATLWVGSKLSYLERLCLKSFADVDQKPIFYHYGEVADIPDFVEVRDAREIYDPGEIIRDPITRSSAVRADLFRLKLLHLTDYIWVDADAYALKPFEAPDGYLFARGFKKSGRVANGVVSLPKDSVALTEMLKFAFDSDLIPPWWSEEQKDAYLALYGKATVWSLPIFSFGPPLWYHYLTKTGEAKQGTPRMELYSIPLRFRKLWDDPDISKLDFLEWQTKTSIHFYGSWFRKIMARRRRFRSGSLMDRLTKKHGIDPAANPL